ncbi:MAG: hypothetical protein SFX73_07385 [Kofleriaceae bacterium]|nr:hypothetical protein [Kofleriaceae bacterium]
MLRASAWALVGVLGIAACGRGTSDECDALKPKAMSIIEEGIDAAAKHAGRGGGSLGIPAPSPADAAKREIAHVRKRFVAACREVGAPALARCIDLEVARRTNKDRAPRDEACAKLDKQLEAALYRGFE